MSKASEQLAKQHDDVSETGNAYRTEIMNVKQLAKAIAKELA